MSADDAPWWPRLVDTDEWRTARDALTEDEQDVNERLQRLAARRRRLPATAVTAPYRFVGPDGPTSLGDLFGTSTQLVVYHFYCPTADADVCLGCSSYVDNLGRTEHLRARRTRLVVTSGAPYERLAAIRERFGWGLPWYSAEAAWQDDNEAAEWAALSCYVRHPGTGEVARTFHVPASTELERLRTDFALLDLTLLGRQETWEDSPAGVPQEEAFSWWRLRDEYDA